MKLHAAMLKSEWKFVRIVKNVWTVKKYQTLLLRLIAFIKKNKEKEDCISHAVINWHCFKHAFCRICVDTAGTNLCCIHKNDKEQNPRQKWLYKKEKMGLI